MGKSKYENGKIKIISRQDIYEPNRLFARALLITFIFFEIFDIAKSLIMLVKKITVQWPHPKLSLPS